MLPFTSKAKKQKALQARIKSRKLRKAIEARNIAQAASQYDWSEHNSDVKGIK